MSEKHVARGLKIGVAALFVGAMAICSSAHATDDKALESKLIDAMRLNADKATRVGDSGAAIQAYVADGLLAKRPNTRADYTNYWWLKRPAPFMGHELVMIEEEYMSRWIGCCVSPGIGITVKLNGSPENLEKFARANGCSIETDADLRNAAKDSHVAMSTLPAGRYATLSCRERDIETSTGK